MRLVETVEPMLLMEHPGHGNQKIHGRRYGKMAAQTIEHGGMSANWIGRTPKTGYMVGGVVESKIIPNVGMGITGRGTATTYARTALASDMKRFVAKNRETLMRPGMYFGTWRDSAGAVHLDVSQRMATRNAVMNAAAGRSERAVYDIRRGVDIDVPEGYPTRGIPDQYALNALKRSATPMGDQWPSR